MGRFCSLFLLITFLLIGTPVSLVQAQDNPTGPTYIIQPGDTLGIIASKFDVTIDAIVNANGILNPNILSAGQALIIPGLEGVSGNLTAEPIPLGANIHNLSVRYQFPVSLLAKLNKITSPSEVYAGSSLILPVSEIQGLNVIEILMPGDSYLGGAIHATINPWTFILQNNIDNTWEALPSQPLFYANASVTDQSLGFPIPYISTLKIDSLPLVQGKTVEITVTGDPEIEISGSLAGNTLSYYPIQSGQYYALQGIFSMAKPGLTDFVFSVSKQNSPAFELSQKILLQPGNYPEDPPLFVDPTTIDPQNTKPEDDLIRSITNIIDPQKYWTGQFRDPVDEPVCIKSWYGNRRSYNGSPLDYFHTGLDYGVCANFNIYAPAAGKVVFTGPLTVRGNATVIDHGQGVFSGFWHQKEINVKVGEMVEPGQLVGLIGDTGRVTGPHLHWEIWVNGVQVNPYQWLEREYP